MMTEELPILKGILNGVVNYHNAPVRFGRVPKREKARILAAMQQSTNSRSQEKAVAAELEDDQKLLRAVIGAHLETCEFTRDKVQPMLLKARDQPSYTACPPTLACPLNPNPQPLTGQQELLQDFSKRFSPAIRGVVEFAKRIPGFSHLTQEDQVTLLKAGVFEVLLVRLACMFDTQNNSMICLNGQVLKRESIHTSSNARFLMDSMFDFAERLNSLRLSDAEIGLFSSIVVIAADRPGLRNTDLIEKMHNKLKAVLQLVIGQNHPGQPNLCQELMKKIPDLRTLNTLHSEKLLAFKMTEQQQQLAQQQQQQSSTTSSSSSWGGVSMMVEDESKSPGGSSSWSSSSDVAMEEVKSPLGSVSSTESVCSGEVASLSEYPGGAHTASAPLLAATLAGGVCPHRHRANSGSTSGDEIKDIKPVVLHHHRGFGRKLDSPSDSGIESGTEKLEKHTGSAPTSVCSSPRSSVEDKEDQSHQAHVEDMPVLKRVLQAPPLYDTNSLMDEAYKPHKKFRALRNKDCAEAESAGAEHQRPPQHLPRGAAAASPAPTAHPRTPPPQQMIVHHQQQTSSLSSTHSTLAKSLMEVPRMTPEQMKRTDIIHNYIMRGSVEGPYGGGGGGSSPHSHSHTRWPTNGTSVITTTSRAVAGGGYPGLYVQQHHPHHHHHHHQQQQQQHQQQQHSPSVSPCPSSSSTASAASCSSSSSSSSSSTTSSSSSSSTSSAVTVGAGGGQCPSSSPLGGVVELQVGTQPLNLSKKTPPPSPRPGPVSAPKALSLEA